MLVSVDVGKYGTKAVRRTGDGVKKFYCRTKVDEISDGAEYLTGHTFKVEHNGRFFKIGEAAVTVDYDTSKAKELHRLSMLLALTKLQESQGEKLTVAIGCPLVTWIDPRARDSFKMYMMEHSNVLLKIDGVEHHIVIDNVIPLPESLGVPYGDVGAYKDGLVGVVDIGGLNTNAAIYDRLKPITKTCFTINEGTHILNAKLRDELNGKFGLNIQDYEISYIIKNGLKVNGEIVTEASSVIDGVFNTHLNIIRDEMRKHNWNLGSLDIHFTGGGSTDMQNMIINTMPHVLVSETGVWDNAMAFLKVGEALAKT